MRSSADIVIASCLGYVYPYPAIGVVMSPITTFADSQIEDETVGFFKYIDQRCLAS